MPSVHKLCTESVGEEVVSLDQTPEQQQRVSMMFDSYIKRCCKNELLNIVKRNSRMSEREISVRSFTSIKIDASTCGLRVPDYVVKGYGITIDDQSLFEALETLKVNERDLILLLFFMGYKPEDLTDELDVVERTVYNRQNKILEKLKKLMEGLK